LVTARPHVSSWTPSDAELATAPELLPAGDLTRRLRPPETGSSPPPLKLQVRTVREPSEELNLKGFGLLDVRAAWYMDGNYEVHFGPAQ
jgi:hypothetical protein